MRNAAVLVMLGWGCAAVPQADLPVDPGHPPPTAADLREWNPNRMSFAHVQPFPGDPRDLGLALGARSGELPTLEEPSVPLLPALPEFWPSITGAYHDQSLGGRLEARLAEFPAQDVNRNGVALLTLPEIFGTEEEDFEDALCEPLGLKWDFDEGGHSYTGDALLWQYSALDGRVLPYEVQITSGCKSALNSGTVADAIGLGRCVETEELSFFAAGTDCRSCLEGGSKWSECEDAGACVDHAPMAWWWNGVDEQRVLIETHYAYVGSCAPDWYSLFLLVALADGDPAPPDAYDSDNWIGYCLPYWDPAIDNVYLGCLGELLDGTEQHVLAEGLFTRLKGIEDSAARGQYWDRPGFAQRVALTNGRRLEHVWAGNGLGHLPAPEDQGGWGLPPTQVRPGGEDGDPEDTYARDLVAAFALKTNTRRNGVLVSFTNHNRCVDGGWVGPDDRGRYLCTEVAEGQDGWSEDGQLWWATDEAGGIVAVIPMMTTLSSGLPDPDVPSGVAIEIRTSPGYEALHGWSYPKTFEPDMMRYDPVPEAVDAGLGGPLIGQTYRFGKDPTFDARMVMGTNWHRFHRPTGGSE